MGWNPKLIHPKSGGTQPLQINSKFKFLKISLEGEMMLGRVFAFNCFFFPGGVYGKKCGFGKVSPVESSKNPPVIPCEDRWGGCSRGGVNWGSLRFPK